jgi:integrase
MRAYIAEFHPGASPDPTRPLFYARHGGVPTHLSSDTVARVLAAAGDMARESVPTVMEGLHCHVMRKSRAMALYESGVPLPIIMQMLGHESMSTTSEFYAFATQDMMARAIADSAPAVVSEDTGWLTEERKKALYSLR